MLAAAALLRRRSELRGTTAIAPLGWSVAALVLVGACEAAIELAGVPMQRAGHVRYLAAMATFCPLMAVLGAKRPQDRGWQFIVASLWLVLSLPGWQALLYWPDAPLQLHGVWRWLFLWPLVVITAANNLPTRYWPAAVLASVGQVLLMQPFLFSVNRFGEVLTDQERVLLAGLLFALAAGLWSLRLPRRAVPAPSIDRAFIEFRDLFGSVWGLRIAARFNAAAVMCQWGVWLTWKGLIETGEQAEDGSPRPSSDADRTLAMRQNLTQLLRRFVSEEWLKANLGGDVIDEAESG